MKSIVLTGATGPVGVALIKECVRNGIRVIAFVRPSSAKIGRVPVSDLVTVLECDNNMLGDFDTVDYVTSPPDVFYHFAWGRTDKQFGLNSTEEQVKNIPHTLGAVRLAKRMSCKKFVGAGSQAEYGCPSGPLSGATPANPEIAYGVAKYAAGKLAKIECEKLNLEYVWVRILSVFGVNNNDDTLINKFIFNCMNNHPMALGPCTHIWDYLYEDDAGRALTAVGDRGASGKVYCLGSGAGRPLKEYLEVIKNMVNPAYVPGYGEIPYSEKSVKYLCADISELTADTGWKPEVPFEEGIGRIVREMRGG